MPAPTRGEIEELQRSAPGVVQDGAQHGGIGDVGLFGMGEVLQLDAEVTAFVVARRQQRAERRVAVERGQAAPDDATTRIDQRAETAVADDAEFEP
jgi:hypothetical protein